MHIQKRRHFDAKTASAKLYIYIGVEARDLYIDEAHTALNIFCFAVFFLVSSESLFISIYFVSLHGLWLIIHKKNGVN